MLWNFRGKIRKVIDPPGMLSLRRLRSGHSLSGFRVIMQEAKDTQRPYKVLSLQSELNNFQVIPP
jgi:hypothetical protein